MIKLRNKEYISGISIYRPSAYDEDTETHSLTRRSNDINSMYYVGHITDVLGVVKGDDGVYYLELDVGFSYDYLVSDYFSTTDLQQKPERLLGSYHEDILDYVNSYDEDYHFDEGMLNSTLRLPFISFTKNLNREGNLPMFDLTETFVSNYNINVELSAVEEYTRKFDNSTGGINFYTDDNRHNAGDWIPIGSGYYIRVNDTLIQNNAYIKYVEETTYWTGSVHGKIPITRRIMDLINEINYTKVEITDDDGVANIYTIKKIYNRGYVYPVLINTGHHGISGGFYHPFLDDTIDMIKFYYNIDETEYKEMYGLINRSVIEHFFNNTDMYMNELRLSDKIKLIK